MTKLSPEQVQSQLDRLMASSEVERITEDFILGASEKDLNQLLLSYRDKWHTAAKCVSVSVNCLLILSERSDVCLAETTNYEARLRGRALLTM